MKTLLPKAGPLTPLLSASSPISLALLSHEMSFSSLLALTGLLTVDLNVTGSPRLDTARRLPKQPALSSFFHVAARTEWES